jgi:hypothetical protein
MTCKDLSILVCTSQVLVFESKGIIGIHVGCAVLMLSLMHFKYGSSSAGRHCWLFPSQSIKDSGYAIHTSNLISHCDITISVTSSYGEHLQEICNDNVHKHVTKVVFLKRQFPIPVNRQKVVLQRRKHTVAV